VAVAGGQIKLVVGGWRGGRHDIFL
jgi:hypothetical protein